MTEDCASLQLMRCNECGLRAWTVSTAEEVKLWTEAMSFFHHINETDDEDEEEEGEEEEPEQDGRNCWLIIQCLPGTATNRCPC